MPGAPEGSAQWPAAQQAISEKANEAAARLTAIFAQMYAYSTLAIGLSRAGVPDGRELKRAQRPKRRAMTRCRLPAGPVQRCLRADTRLIAAYFSG